MKVIVLGASGKIGREIVCALKNEHEVISASRGGDVQVDYTQDASVLQMFEQVGKVDALVNSAGVAGVNAMVWEYPAEEWRRLRNSPTHMAWTMRLAHGPICSNLTV